MWIRWRYNYGSGRWSRWHEVQSTEDKTLTACGIRPASGRIESRERPPRVTSSCGGCGRVTGRTPKRRRPKGRR